MPYELRKAPTKSAEFRKFLDGDYLKTTICDIESDAGKFWARFSPFDTGFPIISTYLPTVMQKGGPRMIYDYDGLGNVKIISDKFKLAIEQIEPNTHQFFPIKMLDRKKNFLADHWIWNICNRVDSVDRKNTNAFLYEYDHGLAKKWRRYNDPFAPTAPAGINPDDPVRFVFNREQIGGYKFWRDPFMTLMDKIYISDCAYEIIVKNQINNICFTEIPSV